MSRDLEINGEGPVEGGSDGRGRFNEILGNVYSKLRNPVSPLDLPSPAPVVQRYFLDEFST